MEMLSLKLLFHSHLWNLLGLISFMELLRFSVITFLWIEAVYLVNHLSVNHIFYHFLFCFLVFMLVPSSNRVVYLVDFSCLKPPNSCRVPFSTFLEHASAIGCFDPPSISFMAKILKSSGQGHRTYLPQPLHYIPPKTHHHDSIQEAHTLFFPLLDDLFSKTSIPPSDINLLILNCSGFSPIPSLSSILVNRYSMREDIKTFNISGMGCSAGTSALQLAHTILSKTGAWRTSQASAVVVSTEILSNGWYAGSDKHKLLINCLFRMGASAALLTNAPSAREWSKYRLLKTLRTQRAFEDKAYRSAIREEDAEGFTGVHLNRDLLSIVADTLRSHISIVGSEILPFSEKLRHVASLLWRRIRDDKTVDVYVPDFKTAVQHFCLPASGKAVIREIGKGMKLTEREMEAALMTLHRFGNQSSSSLWYQMAYLEAKGRIGLGEKVMQLGMGTGPKCSSVIWERLRPVDEHESSTGPWSDCIHNYPILPPPNAISSSYASFSC